MKLLLEITVYSADLEVVRCVVVASPRFTKEQFHGYMLLEAERRSLRALLQNKARIMLARATSGYTHSLQEVLASPAVMALVKDTRLAQVAPPR